MSDFLSGIILGALGGIVFYRIVVRLNLSRPSKKTAAPAPAPEPAPEIVAAEAATPVDEPDDIETVVRQLGKTLSPLAEQIDHPRELPGMPEFKAVLAAFRRPDMTFALLAEYALGANWPLACAAYIVAAERSDGQLLCESTLGHLDSIRPYVLMYALQYFTALKQRPLVGAAILATPE